MSVVAVTTLIDIVGLVARSVWNFSQLHVGALLLLLSRALTCVSVCSVFRATFDVLHKVMAWLEVSWLSELETLQYRKSLAHH